MGIIEFGFIPIGVAILASSIFYARMKNAPVQLVLTVFSPFVWILILSLFLWLPDLFRPLKFGQDDWKPWALVAILAWTILAVPSQIILVYSLKWVFKKRKQSPLPPAP